MLFSEEKKYINPKNEYTTFFADENKINKPIRNVRVFDIIKTQPKTKQLCLS